MNTPRHALLLLAAGQSRRLGQPKQLLHIDGEPLVRRAARLGLATAPAWARIVLGAEADAVAAAVADLSVDPVRCEEPGRGMGASLRAGLASLPAPCDGALVMVCDQPGLDAAHLHAVLAAWRTAPARAVASRYAQVLGVPALLPRAWFGELALLEGDRGARDLLRSQGDNVTAIDAGELAADIDTPEALVLLGTVKRQE